MEWRVVGPDCTAHLAGRNGPTQEYAKCGAYAPPEGEEPTIVQRIVAFGVLALALAACAGESPQPSAPPAVEAVLAGWHHIGLTCKAGQGMPGTLLVWGCTGRLRTVDLYVSIDAGEAGMLDLQAQLPATTDHAIAMATFSDLIRATAAASAAQPTVLPWLQAWDGATTQGKSGNATFRVEIETPWILFQFVPDARTWPPPDMNPMCTDFPNMVCT
jgi:hypothetical protein